MYASFHHGLKSMIVTKNDLRVRIFIENIGLQATIICPLNNPIFSNGQDRSKSKATCTSNQRSRKYLFASAFLVAFMILTEVKLEPGKMFVISRLKSHRKYFKITWGRVNGIGDLISNPVRGWLCFLSHKCLCERSISLLPSYGNVMRLGCKLFNAKSSLFKYIKYIWFVNIL